MAHHTDANLPIFAYGTLKLGMSRESARFQARSALTGSGFTTSESEAVVSHPVRRRIVLFCMLLGSAGLVTVLATLIFTFARANQTQGFERIGIAIAGLFVIFLISRSKLFDRLVTPALARLLGRAMRVELGDFHGLLHLSDGYTVRELYVTDGHWTADRTLGELELRREGALVLGLQRGNVYIGAPTAPVTIRSEDVAILYGSHDALTSIAERTSGPDGDAAHAEAVRRHREEVLGDVLRDDERRRSRRGEAEGSSGPTSADTAA